MADKPEWVETRTEFSTANCTCKLCKRDMSHCGVAFGTVGELQRAHTIAHLQDLVRDMLKVCTCVAKNGWVGRDEVSLSEDILLRSEIIDGGIF